MQMKSLPDDDDTRKDISRLAKDSCKDKAE